MNRLVYESKGASLKQLNDLKVGVLGGFILAAIMLFKAYSTVTEHQYYMSKDEETLMIFYVSMFLVFLVIAVVCVKQVSFCKTCWIKVYEDYLEAKTFTSVLKIEISRIDYVQINKFNLFFQQAENEKNHLQ